MKNMNCRKSRPKCGPGALVLLMIAMFQLWLWAGSLDADAGPSEDSQISRAPIPTPASQAEELIAKGHQLYLMNCAHCHAPDATGDEGPDLHGVKKSDARIASVIKNGVKGEMPRFGSKLNNADVSALIAFIRSLK